MKTEKTLRSIKIHTLLSFVLIPALTLWNCLSCRLGPTFSFLILFLQVIFAVFDAVFSWLPPTSVSAQLPAVFHRWLPTCSFRYACLRTNGHGRCSPRCPSRTAWAGPLKALESAPMQPLLPMRDCSTDNNPPQSHMTPFQREICISCCPITWHGGGGDVWYALKIPLHLVYTDKKDHGFLFPLRD